LNTVDYGSFQAENGYGAPSSLATAKGASGLDPGLKWADVRVCVADAVSILTVPENESEKP
jgi:hypothetical protein